jgi:hypothetical protein
MRRRAISRRSLLSAWPKKCAFSLGFIATLFTAILSFRQLIPTPPVPTLDTDTRVALVRMAKDNRVELRVGLTLSNAGGGLAQFLRPEVSGYVESPTEIVKISSSDVSFKKADGISPVIFPLPVSESASSSERQFFCSISRSDDQEWYPSGLMHVNLEVRTISKDVFTRCFVFTTPGCDSVHNLASDDWRQIPIVDCGDFGGGFSDPRSIGGSN